MQTIKTSPICLWLSGEMNSTLDSDGGPQQLMNYSVERVVVGDDHEIADNDGPIFCSSAEEVLTDGVTKRRAVPVTSGKFRNRKIHQS